MIRRNNIRDAGVVKSVVIAKYSNEILPKKQNRQTLINIRSLARRRPSTIQIKIFLNKN